MRGSESGATAVEFSLIATLLFMFLFGILHFGLAYHRQQGLHAAAREGARLASLGATVDDDAIKQRVRDAAPAFIAPGDLVVKVHTPDVDPDLIADPALPCLSCCAAAGDLVSVTAEVVDPGNRYEARIPMIGAFTPKLDVTATFMCEAARTT